MKDCHKAIYWKKAVLKRVTSPCSFSQHEDNCVQKKHATTSCPAKDLNILGLERSTRRCVLIRHDKWSVRVNTSNTMARRLLSLTKTRFTERRNGCNMSQNWFETENALVSICNENAWMGICVDNLSRKWSPQFLPCDAPLPHPDTISFPQRTWHSLVR